jgi:hypothetical protein
VRNEGQAPLRAATSKEEGRNLLGVGCWLWFGPARSVRVEKKEEEEEAAQRVQQKITSIRERERASSEADSQAKKPALPTHTSAD